MLDQLRKNEKFLATYGLKEIDLERFIRLMVFVQSDQVNFARLDLLELYPERAKELRLESYKSAVEFHILETLIGSNHIQTARSEGLLPNRS